MIGTRKRLKIVTKNGRLTVTARLNRRTIVNERELQIFRTKLIRGLMKPELSGKRKIVYSGPDAISVLSYVRGGISENDFFLMMAQMIEVVKKIDRYNLNINNLILDYQYVFVNTRNREIYFIYQPIITQFSSQSLFSFIQDISYYVVFVPEKESVAVTRFLNSVNQMRTFDTVEAERILQRSCPDIYRKFRRSKTGQSCMLNDRQWGTDNGDISCPDEGDVITVLVDQDDDDATTVLKNPDGENTTSFDEDNEAYPDWKATTYQDENCGAEPDKEHTAYPPTTPLEPQAQNSPCIISLRTFEMVHVDKPVFRIGVERSKVDYFVPNNNVVSRLHADIITEQDSYFIRDNNSKNGTFVNGNRVDAGQKVCLSDGDRIVLANEEFEFCID